MNKELLLLVAAKLETLPPERFDYSIWVGREWRGMPDIGCGAPACALGWATTIPEIAAKGLALRLAAEFDPFNFGAIVVTPKTLAAVRWWKDRSNPAPEGQRLITPSTCPFYAAAEVFEINRVQAEFLFLPAGGDGEEEHPGEEATAVQVAHHIRRFVESDGQSMYYR